jgi:predicted RNase H-like HicB family nuclease
MACAETPLAWPVTLVPAKKGGFVVNLSDFPEGWSQGDSRDEAIGQATDLLETMVANYMAEGWDLPDPSPPAGRWRRWSPPRRNFTARCARPGLPRPS